jgi:hypothetical protein
VGSGIFDGLVFFAIEKGIATSRFFAMAVAAAPQPLRPRKKKINPPCFFAPGFLGQSLRKLYRIAHSPPRTGRFNKIISHRAARPALVGMAYAGELAWINSTLNHEKNLTLDLVFNRGFVLASYWGGCSQFLAGQPFRNRPAGSCSCNPHARSGPDSRARGAHQLGLA